MTEEDDVLVCAQGEGWMSNAKEQQGYVKVFTHALSAVISNVSNSKPFDMLEPILGVY